MEDFGGNPWKTLRSRIAYKNSWISVREDAVITPAGGEGIYGVVQAPGALGVVALTPNNEVYLVGQYRYPVNEYSWEIVEGGREAGESLVEAAQRELREEAGLVALRFEQLGGEVHTSNCFTDERAYLYIAQDFSEVATAHEVTEKLQIEKVALGECLAMIDRSEIKDAMSIIALQRAAKFIGVV